MVFAFTKVGVSTYSPEQFMHGRPYLVSGEWDCDTVTAGEIVTGGSRVLAFDVANYTTEKGVKCKSNVDGTGTAALGSIGILASTQDDVGEWWAIVLP